MTKIYIEPHRQEDKHAQSKLANLHKPLAKRSLIEPKLSDRLRAAYLEQALNTLEVRDEEKQTIRQL